MRGSTRVSLLLCAAAVVVGLFGATTQSPSAVGPRYTAEGALLRPDGIESWTLVGASLGLGYGTAAGTPPGVFHRVYLEPSAFARYRRTGRFPDGTMLALTGYLPSARVPPATQGWFEGESAGLEMAVKDLARGGWSYYGFDQDRPGATARAFPPERCRQCHAEHAARDNVFAQFYPTLRDPRP
jgi:hypothetical protein